MTDMHDGFVEVADLGEAGLWVRIRDEAAAQEAGRLTNTAVGHYYRFDSLDGTGSMRHRYYGLLQGDGMPVVLRVPLEGEAPSGRNAILVTGYRNGDPYPDHAGAIEALASKIGVPLPPESYPYGGLEDGNDDVDQGAPTP